MGAGILSGMMHSADSRLASLIAARVLGEEAVEAVPLTGYGSVNTIFRVRAGACSVVVRMQEAPDALAEYHKEAWCLQRASAAGIPSPAVLAVGTDEAVAYMVQTHVPGINGKHSEADHTRIWHKLGGYARLIHAIPVAGFGHWLADPAQGVFDDSHAATWADFVRYNIESLTPQDELLTLGVYTEAQRGKVKENFEYLAGRPVRNGLCHGDLALRNALQMPTGEVALLDWGCAHVHLVPHYDLAEMLLWHRPNEEGLQAFLDGYGLSTAAFEAILPDVKRLQSVKAFDLVRWAIDRRPEGLQRYVERARETLLWWHNA